MMREKPFSSHVALSPAYTYEGVQAWMSIMQRRGKGGRGKRGCVGSIFVG